MKKDSLKQKEINWVIESLTMFNKRWCGLYSNKPDDEINIIQLDFGITENWVTIKVINQAHLTQIIDFLRFMDAATSLDWYMEEEEGICFKIF